MWLCVIAAIAVGLATFTLGLLIHPDKPWQYVARMADFFNAWVGRMPMTNVTMLAGVVGFLGLLVAAITIEAFGRDIDNDTLFILVGACITFSGVAAGQFWVKRKTWKGAPPASSDVEETLATEGTASEDVGVRTPAPAPADRNPAPPGDGAGVGGP